VPELSNAVQHAIVDQPGLEAGVAAVLALRLADAHVQARTLHGVLTRALAETETRRKLRVDLKAIMDRDPAADGPLNALLNFKGFHALQTYRAAHILYHTPGRQPLALWLQSRASQVFGADIHPAARLGEGLFLDHATGVVIGATAATGPNCSFLHGVTLGATGKDGGGERHPKLGANVLVGCGASILGNIQIGDNAKIGASSIVLRPIPAGATAVGVPAKVVGGTPPVGKPVETIAGKEAGMATAGAPLKKLEESPGSALGQEGGMPHRALSHSLRLHGSCSDTLNVTLCSCRCRHRPLAKRLPAQLLLCLVVPYAARRASRGAQGRYLSCAPWSP